MSSINICIKDPETSQVEVVEFIPADLNILAWKFQEDKMLLRLKDKKVYQVWTRHDVKLLANWMNKYLGVK